MPGNTFGEIFKVTTCGESHGGAIAAIVDGCPSKLKLSEKDIQVELDKRRPGQSQITSQRNESDEVKILSGIINGLTTGTPILLLIKNKDAKSEDYGHLKNLYRPGHADYTYQKKYGIREWRGGGRASARETATRVAAGAIAQKYLKEKANIEFLSYTEQIGNVKAHLDFKNIKKVNIEKSIVRCPEKKISQKMINLIKKIKKNSDSIGGLVRGIIRNVPIGLGEPVFDKLSADLAKAMMSIGAAKGFDIGSGFLSVEMLGSQHNDELYIKKGIMQTKKNNAGGTLGGISNGESINFRVAFKPTSTIQKKQNTITTDNHKTTLKAAGRHDPCIVPRAVPVVDAMAALVIMDHYLRHKVYK